MIVCRAASLGVVMAILSLVCTGAGCSTVGSFPATTNSTTSLSRANFRVIEGNVRGQDTGLALFGFIPIVSPSYSNAMSNLRSKVPIAGKAAAMANVTQDNSTVYLILFSLPRITVTADVIEFLPEGPTTAAAGPPAAPDPVLSPMIVEPDGGAPSKTGDLP